MSASTPSNRTMLWTWPRSWRASNHARATVIEHWAIMKARCRDTAYDGRRPRRIVRSLRSNARSFMRCKEDARIPYVNDFPQLAGV
jgi:hypothetical protein